MNILIIGAGSLGLLFAGKLSGIPGSGANIRLLTRTAEQAELINRSGLYIWKDDYKTRIDVDSTSFDAHHISDYDWIFLMVKQTHLNESLLRDVQGLMKDRTKLLCFQNGIGHVERLTAAGIPVSQIYAAITTVGARKEAANIVRHTGDGVTSMGCAAQGGDGDALQELARLWQQAEMSSAMDPQISLAVLRKLLINSIINPLTSILGISNGELLANAHNLTLMKALYEEACEVLRESGLPISEELWEQVLEVCRKTSANSSSTLQDLRAGRETEIDWINGSIVRLAEAYRLNVPTHEAVYHIVKGLEHRGG